MNPRFEKAAMAAAMEIDVGLDADFQCQTATLILEKFEPLADAHDLAMRCLENLNRNGSVSPQLAAEALAAIKGEA